VDPGDRADQAAQDAGQGQAAHQVIRFFVDSPGPEGDGHEDPDDPDLSGDLVDGQPGEEASFRLVGEI
jgi:hypothetical protein